MMKIKKLRVRLLIFLSIIILPHLAQAQFYRLQEIELLNMAGFYRVMFQCDGPVTYLDKFEKSPPSLIIYLKNTRLDLPKKDFTYQFGLVKGIHIVQLRKWPAVAKISIVLHKPVQYRIKKNLTGLFYIDLEPEKSKSRDSSKLKGFDTLNQDEPSDLFSLSENQSKPPSNNHAFLESKSLRDRSGDRLPIPLTSKEVISLDVNNAELSNVLRLIAKQGQLNIVASKDVSGIVTVSLSSVTIKDALDLVVKANGFDYIIENDVVLVKPRDKFEVPDLETKVYRLKYVDANNLKSTVEQILSPQAKVQVYYHSYRPEQTKSETGQVSKSKNRSSTLIVTDSRANIKQLNAMIAALDVPTPQIMIEAKLIEISPQSEQKLGIDWAKTINAQIFRDVLLPSGTPQRQSVEIPLTGGSISYGTLTFDEYSAVIDFLNKNTNSKLVSNPRILAMDNQEASISVGTTFPIPQINRGVGGQGDVVTFEYLDVNITLRVIPHIGDDDTVTLFVNPEVEEVIGEVRAGENSAPITSKRTVETVVNLRNNETMVIGGLIRENTIDTISKVWLLGDIPLIGNFFRHKNKTKKQTDLLIFITPRLVDGS